MISGPTASQLQAIRTTALVACPHAPIRFTSPAGKATTTP